VLSAGARQALAGEFSFRAVRNGKLSVTQAHAVADLMAASSTVAQTLALEKLQGSQGLGLGPCVEELRTLAALAEVGIDFSDQDVEEVSLRRLKERLSGTLQGLQVLQSSYERGRRIQDGLRLAFVGLPNAGKSSFFNRLLGEERSIISSVPGTTRDVVHERLTLKVPGGSCTARVEDTAGLRDSTDPVESQGIERSRTAARSADLILWVVNLGTWASDLRALERLWDELGAPVAKTLVIPNQADRFPASARGGFEGWVTSLGLSTTSLTSCLSGQGVEEAIVQVGHRLGSLISRTPGEILLTRLSELEAVEGCIEHLNRALQTPSEDLFAADLRQALVALEPLAGKTPPDELLGRIFSSFCIGK
jgi:tRNA modification GTPase